MTPHDRNEYARNPPRQIGPSASEMFDQHQRVATKQTRPTAPKIRRTRSENSTPVRNRTTASAAPTRSSAIRVSVP